MLLHSRIRAMGDGETLKVLATDPSTERDIPKFCSFLGHELLLQERIENQFHYLLRKKGAS